MRALLLTLTIATLVPLACRAAPSTKAAAPQADTVKVAVVTEDGRRFEVRVELAATEEERAKGLMFRHRLGVDEGMLFLFPDEAVQSFWMKNTVIPLDMIFIRADGTIAGVVDSAEPHSLRPRSVGRPSRYVLEVNAGWAKRNGVKAGDRVELQAALAKAGDRVR